MKTLCGCVLLLAAGAGFVFIDPSAGTTIYLGFLTLVGVGLLISAP